jgi:hypothetical protein
MNTTKTADDETSNQDESDEVLLDNQTEESNPSVEEKGNADSGDDNSESDKDSAESDKEDALDEVVVKIEGESPSQEAEERAPEWVRNVRKTNREQQKRIKELEEKLKSLTPAPEAVQLGSKPTLADCECDTDKFEIELEKWHDRKRQVEAEAQRAKADEAKQQQAWAEKLNGFEKAKTSLKVKDFEDAEAVVQELFEPTQIAIMIEGAKAPAELVYALGKNPKKAKELAEIKNPVRFAFELAKLETRVSVERKKTAPPPEGKVKGAAPISGSLDSTLERLRAEADRTGDRSKVAKYLKSQRK